MLTSDCLVDRSASVSSMRRMNVPPWPRASSQLKSAVRALPTCSWPVGLGLGAKLPRTPASDRLQRHAQRVTAGSSSTACAAIASPRPTASTPSFVFPLMLTRDASMPIASATLSRMRSM